MSGYILVVDDEPDVRQLFKITLNMAGYRTEVAEDGLKAMEAVAREIPKLILLDLMMPRMDGFSVLDRLREDRPDGNLKVLIATAKSLNDTDKARLDSWPVVGVLNKGELDLARMVSHVQKLLEQPAENDKTPGGTPPVSPPAKSPTIEGKPTDAPS